MRGLAVDAVNGSGLRCFAIPLPLSNEGQHLLSAGIAFCEASARPVFLANSTWVYETSTLALAPPSFTPVRHLLQWYYVAVGFCFVPFMAVANSYGAGLTDQDNSSMYGKLCIFIFAAWAGTANQGVIAGLGMCGVILSATSQAASLMQVRLIDPLGASLIEPVCRPVCSGLTATPCCDHSLAENVKITSTTCCL